MSFSDDVRAALKDKALSSPTAEDAETGSSEEEIVWEDAPDTDAPASSLTSIFEGYIRDNSAPAPSAEESVFDSLFGDDEPEPEPVNWMTPAKTDAEDKSRSTVNSRTAVTCGLGALLFVAGYVGGYLFSRRRPQWRTTDTVINVHFR